MRAFLPATILSLAVTFMWFGGPATAAEVVPPGLRPTPESQDMGDPSQCLDEDQSPMSDDCCNLPCDSCNSCDCCQCGPRWTFAGEAIAFQRSTTRSQPLYYDTDRSTELLNSRDMNFPYAAGYRLDAIRHNECGWDVEVGYFAVDSFAARGEVPYDGNLKFMVTDNSGDYLPVTSGDAVYTSALYSGEVNVRRQIGCCDWLTLLAGFRMLQLNERYNAYGTFTVVDGERTEQQSSFAYDGNVSAVNHLYGFQLGADAELYNMCGPLVINGLCKAGIFGNSARQVSSRGAFIDGTEVASESLSASHCQAAFLGEAGLVATYALTKHVALRASYEAMWLESVALAPEQLSSVNFTAGTVSVNTTGSVFYHGGGVGLECRF